jgi:hypothetical protein
MHNTFSIWPRHRGIGREDSIFIAGNGGIPLSSRAAPLKPRPPTRSSSPALPSQHARGTLPNTSANPQDQIDAARHWPPCLASLAGRDAAAD